MYVACKPLFVTLLIATFWHGAYATYNVTAYCTMIKSGTLLPSDSSCSEYFACTNPPGSYENRECSKGYSFDKNKQSCQPSSNVDCYYGLENPCQGKNNTHVPDVSKCGAWFYCLEGQIKGKGQCSTGQVFIDGSCQWGPCTPGSDPEDNEPATCDIFPINVWFGSTADCEIYYICRAGQAVPQSGACKDNTVFDVTRQTCNYRSSTDCSRVTGADVPGGGGDESCTVTDIVKPNINVCSEYLKCDGKKFVQNSCPAGQYWDEGGAKCLARNLAVPVATCNRCEGTSYNFVNSVNQDCDSYQICKKGKKVGEGECENGYFDEESQACITNPSADQLQNYKNSHPVCQGGGNTDPPSCDKVCGGLDTCAATDECKCALNAEQKCIDCGDGVITEGVCEVDTPPADDCVCDGEAADGECKDASNAECNCGFDASSTCGDCDVESFTCEDCICQKVNSKCINIGLGKNDCKCGFEEDVCEECASGAVEDDGTCTPAE